jgi:hypothetical protein
MLQLYDVAEKDESERLYKYLVFNGTANSHATVLYKLVIKN